MVEFTLYKLPKKMAQNEVKADKALAELNELGRQGWQVVAAIAEQSYGSTTMLVLQRATQS